MVLIGDVPDAFVEDRVGLLEGPVLAADAQVTVVQLREGLFTSLQLPLALMLLLDVPYQLLVEVLDLFIKLLLCAGKGL